MENQTDKALTDAFRDGDRRAMEILYNRYKGRLFLYIKKFVLDHYLAEDLLQDLFFKIMDNIRLGRYQDEGKFIYWALFIAHNICIDHFRIKKNNPRYTDDEVNDIFDFISNEDLSAEAAIIKRETLEQVKACVDRLPEPQREVVAMRYYAQESFRIIADKTNCSINTALGRMRYALINLRKMAPDIIK